MKTSLVMGWMRRIVAILLLALAFAAPATSTAQSLTGLTGDSGSDTPSEPNVIELDDTGIAEIYRRWLDEIVEIERGIAALRPTPNGNTRQVDDLVDRIAALTAEVDRAAATAREQLQQPEQALAAIGPPPAADEQPEARLIAEERERHQRSLAALQAVRTYVRLIKTRAEAATGRLASYGQDRLKTWLLTRHDLHRLLDAADQFDDANDLFRGTRASRLQSSRSLPGDWFAVLLSVLAAASVALSLWMVRSVPKFGNDGRWEELEDRRDLAVVRVYAALGFGVLPALACLSLAGLTLYFAPDTGYWRGIIAGILLGLAVYVWLFRIFKVALAPTREQAQFLRGSDHAAEKAVRLLHALCALIAIFIAGFVALGLAVDIGARTLLALKVAAALGFAGYATFAACMPMFGPRDPDRLRRIQRTVRIGAAVMAAVAIVTVLAGYVNFAMFASVHIAGSVLLAFATYFIRPILHEGIRALFSNDGDSFRQTRRGLTEVLAHLALDLTMLSLFVALMLALWGVPFDAVWLWIKQATNALEFGEFRIGLSDVTAAAINFMLALVLLRAGVRLIRNKVLEPLDVDIGIRDSISTILGYVSFLLAAIVAIVTLGFDITSLALVFGALLLGAGFGLQHLVDNVVSGLIILFQRPIKSGDWIDMGDHEGLVRRTGLVSTEISTFDDASVVLPNSEIVSSAVLNRTLGLKRGRVDVPVGVAYGSDVRAVLRILRDCAAENDYVLTNPEPTVVLRDFSDSSLHFELRAFIPDIRNIFELASELRIAILDRFAEEGIEIPFPQRDVWLRRPDTEAPPDSPGNKATPPGGTEQTRDGDTREADETGDPDDTGAPKPQDDGPADNR